jgi:hypothetical protein
VNRSAGKLCRSSSRVWPSAKWITAFPTGVAFMAGATVATDAIISAARPEMSWVSSPIVSVTSNFERLPSSRLLRLESLRLS